MERGVVRVVPVIEVSPISTPGTKSGNTTGVSDSSSRRESRRFRRGRRSQKALANSYTKADHGSQEPRVKLMPASAVDAAIVLSALQRLVEHCGWNDKTRNIVGEEAWTILQVERSNNRRLVKKAPMVKDDGAKLRRELRGAATAEELTRLIEKAAKAGYKHEAEMGMRKLLKLK
ncbi:hypothetical protein FOL46_005220 [Perkinsus olseni]|nr:hypothetical protein FOL46_005220 [Perkinsus olseni]